VTSGQTLVLLIIAGIFGLIGWLIGRPKGHAVWGFFLVQPRGNSLLVRGYTELQPYGSLTRNR